MAKIRKAEPPQERAPLAAAIGAFAAGDYVAARAGFDAARADSLSESERETAAQLTAATRVDGVTVYVGLACVGLAAIVVAVTSFLQP